MEATSAEAPLAAEFKPHVPKDGLPPSHHVLAPAPGTTFSSYLPHWNAQPTLSAAQQDVESAQSAQVQNDSYDSNLTCLPSSIALVDSAKVVRIGFRNPWPSWHKPSLAEVWQGLEWGEDQDPAIDYALQDADVARNARTDLHQVESEAPYQDSRPGTPDQDGDRQPASSSLESRTISATQYTRSEKIKIASKQLLSVHEPSFDFDHTNDKLKATWLGHAGVLLQLAPLEPKQEPIRILFDPIFSQRCSPIQLAGPIRSYAAPCAISSLPPIDLVVISHNHYDHLDYDTIKELWAANKGRIRFVVPLGNKDWFVGASTFEQAEPETASTTSSSSYWTLAPSSVTTAATTSNLSILPDRVSELDWWDEILFSQPGSTGKQLRIVCTPAQHGSGRYGVDANCALWSSWFVEHPGVDGAPRPIRAFFGGDTGCQFHGRAFPPAPPRPTEEDFTLATPTSEASDGGSTLAEQVQAPTYRGGMRLQVPNDDEEYPACPAFEEIVARLGAPNFFMLPISVGATISFLRSYVPLPDSISPFPRLSAGLTAANHMPPWDAVGIFDKMTSAGVASGSSPADAVCLAIHWGTFISGPEEVLKTLGQLKWACHQHGIHFARDYNASLDPPSAKGRAGNKTFVALNHGASLTL
ncbi:hypothetical protein PaG_03816 [Moesziomyces aphidis]|jgi:L-ascorbate metabolism protein UlaG (beta-lactamase superfamily)|uniref:Metallo-beta-lactamase domain-containing protein n=1 Tax=Moesziomyces aphidis TaxID=84754 RepID=W3VL34_MOEAP|nr:hypothetical protein PaG_03816 [Moesziomyces aphidis]